MSEHFRLMTLRDFGDQRGGMCVLEGGQTLPFEIRRIFYDFHTTGAEPRGSHANLHSQFAFVSVAGSCVVDADDGFQQARFLLDDPHKLLWLDKMTWKTMHSFSADNVLLVLSDCHYDAEEYIRDYETFQALCRKERV